MKVYSKIPEIRQFSRLAKKQQMSVGFVPTMGALHAGHLALIEHSKLSNDITICSIFVNPMQFNNPDDLKKYPKDIDADLALLKNLHCDAVFVPSINDMYPEGGNLSISFGYLEEIMEGKFRPNHFKGVGLIVSKLFNIVTPDRAYFGQKDLQQLAIIKTLVSELNFNIEVIPVKTMRESDGLAMSSRNTLLSDEERKLAPNLFLALTQAREKLIQGESVNTVKDFVQDFIQKLGVFDLEYFEIVGTNDLKNIDEIDRSRETSLCIAAHLGKVRLIDNLLLF